MIRVAILYQRFLAHVIQLYNNFYARNGTYWYLIKPCSKINVSSSKATIFCTIFRLIRHDHTKPQKHTRYYIRSYARLIALGI